VPALILLTSMEAKEFPVHRLGTLYRVRWQIEPAFKRLKSLLHIDQLRARNAALTRAWPHAHLLFALRIEQTVAEIDAIPS
jgi:IS4 transposase